MATDRPVRWGLLSTAKINGAILHARPRLTAP
jgi:hypothetical protein